MTHTKHPPLARPKLGFYARTEFALVGTVCARIHELLERWAAALEEEVRVLARPGAPGHFGNDNPYADRLLGAAYDLVLTNGNHFRAAKQIVFVDPAKAGSLERRREQLTDVALVVRCPGTEQIPDWLPNTVPTCLLAEVDQVALPIIRSAVRSAVPPVKALLLAGGKSERMGEDKAGLVYRNGQSELGRLAAIVRSLGMQPYVSLRDADSVPSYVPPDLPIIADRFQELGPHGAICSALITDPDSAWLVLACDLPLLEREDVAGLLSSRDPKQYATALRGADRPFPEPLIAIYEPRAYRRLLEFLSLGYACPRKMLINSEIAEVITEPRPLTNANTPEERAAVLERLTVSVTTP